MSNSNTTPAGERSISEETDTQPPQSPIVSVVVTKMPEVPSKPLFKDATRLLSIAAFIFSVATGLFATYQTWRNSREATVDTVSKLIDQYYAGSEKLATLNEDTDLARMNLLRSQLRSTASRTASLAVGIRGDIDDGTWLAVAQINDNEDNLHTAESAWLAAIQKTKDISVYIYAMRNLASNQLRQSKRDDAGQSYRLALDAGLNDRVKATGIVNEMPPDARFSQAALTHAFWLVQFEHKECPFVVHHFDDALKFIADASRHGQTADLESQRRIIATRELLNRLEKHEKLASHPVPPSNWRTIAISWPTFFTTPRLTLASTDGFSTKANQNIGRVSPSLRRSPAA